ncbi:hypothetical protein RJ639_037800 [Escallonia herrerae]|uniref:Transcription repressor n=2 Tax=Escallonia herrerae TaxID=1293975 RepID=A0AA88WJN0_9ASTE|nr:hypothetical protein RJ639_037800 [Escallonia herrerae]
MPRQLQKTLSDYLHRIKKSPTSPIRSPSKTLSSSTSWVLRGCKHPKTPSFAVDRTPDSRCHDETDNEDAATLSDIDRFLFENFKSLYQEEYDGYNEKKKNILDNKEEKSDDFSFGKPRLFDPPRGLRGSRRFFVGSGSSSSLIEEARTSVTTSEETGSSSTATTNTTHDSPREGDDAKEKVMKPDDFITVLTYSQSPYDDFRRSMQEMIQARLHHRGKVNWEFMEELLFCYINLNDKKSYRYILRAFVDLVVALRENPCRIPAGSPKVRGNQDMRKKRGDVT